METGIGISRFQELGHLRQGLSQKARKGGGEWPARRGGDFRSPRKPAGPVPGTRGLAGESPKPPPNNAG